MSEGLAKVVNTAQTKGFSAAQAQLSVQLEIAEAELLQEGITLTFLDKLMFKVTGTAANLGVAFQTMMAKVMPFITGILMALPLLQGFAKFLGFSGAAAKALKDSISELDDTMELLAPRMDHVNEQFDNFGDDFVAYNKGLESFQETVLTTVTAINKAADALAYYRENTKLLVQAFDSDTLKQAAFGMFFDTADEKINKAQAALIKTLKEGKFGMTKSMEDLVKEFDEAGNSFIGGLEKRRLFVPIAESAEASAKGVRNMRSAIDGAADSARAFTNAFLKSTEFDKPLASLRQINAALEARQQLVTVEDDGSITRTSGELVLTELQRLNYAKELNENQALRAIMTQEERDTLADTTTTGEGYLKVLKDIEDRFFRQQQITIRIKSELQEISKVSKIFAKSQKVTAESTAKIIRLESASVDLNVKKTNAQFESARSATNLTEEQVKQFALSRDLLDFENDKRLEGENSVQVQAAISAFKERELVLLDAAISKSTEQERLDLARAKIALQNLAVQEKINKLNLQKETIEKRIAKFESSGETELTGVDQIQALVKAEETRLKTADKRLKLETTISNLQFKVLELEMKVMKQRAIQTRQEIAAVYAESVAGFEKLLQATGVEAMEGSLAAQFLEMEREY